MAGLGSGIVAPVIPAKAGTSPNKALPSPSPEFSGAGNHTLDIEGDRITVFYKATRAQAIRTNFRPKEVRLDAISRLTQAIETVTGCAVRPKSLKGDTVLVTANLKCP